jgi:hypothetical protein
MEIILEKLKVKPNPKKKEDLYVKLPNKEHDLEEVDLTKLLEKNPDFIIYDKTKQENDFNPNLFLKTINEKKRIRQNIPNISTKKVEEKKEDEISNDIKQDNNNTKRVKKSKPNVDISRSAVHEISHFEIGDEIKQRLPKQKDIVLIKKPNYYMNNREYFLTFINSLFSDYRKEVVNAQTKVECDRKTKNVISKRKDGTTLSTDQFSLLTHQKIILDYLNIYTPYRGLLIYHGLGSGKTCSSIAVAESYISAASSIAFTEGFINSKKVIVMTPASLRVNYFEELKKCGNPIYKKKQYWEFIQLSDDTTKEMLSNVLHLPVQYIEKSKGAWMVDVTKNSNYDTLSPIQKQDLDKQLNEMIHNKYQFINYNGIQKKHVNTLTKNNTINPFDNKVVIIDEAHNFISRIVNKLGKSTDINKFTSTILYHNLMKAQNVKIVLLSGTPIINYPNEIAILYNILRGYIKTIHIPILSSQKKFTLEGFKKIFFKHELVDYIEYNSGVLQITRTPFSFSNKFWGLAYKGVRYTNKEEYNDNNFIDNLVKVLSKNNVSFMKDNIKIVFTKTLPDKLDEFQEYFFNPDTGNMKNVNLFKRRILGLTSYFKSAQEGLMPEYDVLKDTYRINIEMSDYQFVKYQEIRLIERSNENNRRKQSNKKKSNKFENDDDPNTTYRIFSRCFCNFVFPDPPGRPMPSDSLDDSVKNIGDEDNIDGISMDEKKSNIDGRFTEDDQDEQNYDTISYNMRIKNALDILHKESSKYLVGDNLKIFSPKFSHILENVDSMRGLHLLYSQFRTIEGIQVFSMVLEANGYTKFKIKKNSSQEWIIDSSIDSLKRGKSFTLYTGTESAEEKEIIRNIYNGTWEYLPYTLTEQLKQINNNNINGEIIKLFMITSSGAEGISLMNTKYIHIMEPYWHPVRTQQVIGRARRICSHVDLPEEERKIKVFYYIMKFTDKQIESKMNIDIRNNDISKLDRKNLRPFTSDESLYEICQRKEKTNSQILQNIKEASIDCAVHSTSSSNELLECYSFGNNVDPNIFSYKPNIQNENKDGKQNKLNEVKEQWRAKKTTINNVDYAIRLDNKGKETDMIYDLDTYLQALKNPNIKIMLVGKVVNKDGKRFIDSNIH